jgi:hypothetical protein
MVIIRQNIASVEEEKSEPSSIADDCKMVQHNLAVFQIVKHIITTLSNNFTPRYISKRNENRCSHKTCILKLTAALLVISKSGNKPNVH